VFRLIPAAGPGCQDVAGAPVAQQNTASRPVAGLAAGAERVVQRPRTDSGRTLIGAACRGTLGQISGNRWTDNWLGSFDYAVLLVIALQLPSDGDDVRTDVRYRSVDRDGDVTNGHGARRDANIAAGAVVPRH
jgi:hypothetical protein